MRNAALIAVLLAILAAAVWFAYGLWNAVDFPDIPTSGYVAMGLGIVFSLVIGCGLMALVFYSSRHGYDEASQYRDGPEQK
jgi:hypothetical protein